MTRCCHQAVRGSHCTFRGAAGVKPTGSLCLLLLIVCVFLCETSRRVFLLQDLLACTLLVTQCRVLITSHIDHDRLCARLLENTVRFFSFQQSREEETGERRRRRRGERRSREEEGEEETGGGERRRRRGAQKV